MTNVVLALIVAYLLGSIPFGLILTKLAGKGDVRKLGSGNIGATNVLRTGNKGLAAVTLILDIAKGAAGVYAAAHTDPNLMPVGGFAAFLGHLYPVWLKFKGGKGVATFVGVVLAINWMAGLGVLAVWIIMAFAFRYSSLASLTAATAAPALVYWLDSPEEAVWIVIMTFVIFFAHTENIKRLAAGEESKIGSKSQK